MVKCTRCGYDNPPGELICGQCDMLLTESAKEGETRNLNNPENVTNFPRWGTARLGDERKLLFYVRGYEEPLVISLADEMVVGRYDTTTGDAPEIDLEAYGAEEEGVSRRHAAIIDEGDALKVIDLGSANATFINGQKLIAHQARILRDGDELRLGHLVIRVHFA